MFILFSLVFSENELCAQTAVSFTPVADSYIDQGAATTNYGSVTTLYTYPWSPSFSRRSIVKFDLTAITGVTIVSAYLSLNEAGSFGLTRTVNFHRLTTNWSENTVTWNSPWTSAGGDYTSTASGSFSSVYPGIDKDSVNVTSDVQAFVNGSVSNYGWLFKDNSENTSQNWWTFASKENSTAANRPVLRIKFTGSPLPIELLSFYGKCNDNELTIHWTTASEKNNDYFLVEESKDGLNWLELHQEKGAGNSNVTKNYSFTHFITSEELRYYRLKQVDFDKKFDYSKVIFPSGNCLTKELEIKVYPNPASDKLFFESGENVSEIKGTDGFGQTIFLSHQHNTVSLTHLQPGVYMFTFTTITGKSFFRKVIKE